MKKQEETKKHQGKHNNPPDNGEEFKNLDNQLKRALADYQNLEKRVVSEKSEWVKLANKGLLFRLLPALDNLSLAEKHTQDKGVTLSIDQMISAFKEEGIEKIETMGRDFDPNLMEAVHVAEGQEGKVAEEVRAGYTLFGQVLRPAQVAVGKGEN
jgi:molecular chaperone GrpE